MAKAGTAYIEVLGDFSKLRRQLATEMAALGNKDVKLDVDVNERGLDGVNRKLNETQRAATGADGALGGLGRTVKRISPGLISFKSRIPVAQLALMGTGAYNAAGGLIALGGALAPLSGLLGAIGPLATTLAQAKGTLSLATADLEQAVGGLNEELDEESEAFQRLSPEAQQFARTLQEFKPAIRELQRAAQKGLFPGAERGIRSAMKNLPALKKVIGDTAEAFGGLAEAAGRRLGSREWGKDLELQGRRNEVTIRRLGNAGLDLAEIFKDVTIAAGPLVDRLTGWIGALTEATKRSVDAARESGRLQAFFKDAGDTFFKTVRIVTDLSVAFKNVGSAARRAFGNELLGAIERGARALREWTGSVQGQRELVSVFRDIGDNLRAAAGYVKDLGERFRGLRRDGASAGEAIGTIFTEVLADVITKVAESVPRLARAFVEGFLNANIWGKLAAGAFLIQKFGGPGAWAAIGRRLGRPLGLGMSQSAAAATGAALPTALGRQTSRLQRIGRFGLGAALAVGIGAAMTDSRDGIANRIQQALSVVTLGIFPGVKAIGERLKDAIKNALQGGEFVKGGFGAAVGFDKFLDSLDKNLPDAEKKIANKFVAIRRAAGEMFGKGIKLKLDVSTATGQRDFAKIEENFNRLKNRLAGDATSIARVTRTQLGLMAKYMDLDSAAGQRAVTRNMKLTVRAITSSVDVGASSARSAFRAIRRTFIVNSVASKETAQKNFGLARDAVRNTVKSAGLAADVGLREIRKLFFAYLAQFGIKGRAAEIYMRNVPKTSGGGGKTGGVPLNYAKGGLVQFGQPGGTGRDNIPVQFGQQRVAVGSGEVGAVFNRHQLPVLNARLSDMGGLPGFFKKFDRKHSHAQGGFVGGLKRFATGGIVGMMAAARKLDRAHFDYKWGGGHAATPAPFGPMDCSGAVSYVLQHGGVKIPTMVSGALASAGQPGAGAVTVYANPNHTFMRIGKNYFGTSGTNPGGGAGFFPDPGAGYRSGFTQRHFVGGPGDFGGAQQIGKFVLGGPDTALKAGVQAGLNAARATSNDVLGNVVGAPIGEGDIGDAGAGWSKDRLRRLWVKAGGKPSAANLAAAVALAESGGSASASNSNSNGSIDRGLWQINSIHGRLSTFDPLANARAAVQISSNGSNWNPWVAYTTGRHRQFLAKGGLVGYVGDSLGVGTAPKLKGRIGDLVANVAESRTSAQGLKVLKGMLGKKYGRYIWDLGTNDPDAGAVKSNLKAADKATGDKLLLASTVLGNNSKAKNQALHALAGGDVNVFEWAKRSKGLVGADGIHATGKGYSQRAAMMAGALKAATARHKDKGGPDAKLPKLKGTLRHGTRQTVRALTNTKDKKRRAKILRRFEKFLKKYGLPTKLLGEIKFLAAAHDQFSEYADNAESLDVTNEDDTITRGLFRGQNVGHWLTADLGAMFKARNKLVKARDIVTVNQKKVQSTLGFVKQQLEDLSKPGHTPRHWEGVNPAKDKVEKWNKQAAPKRHRLMKKWRHRHGKLPGTREFNTFTGKIKETPKSRIPALKDVKTKLTNQNVLLKGAISPEGNEEASIIPQIVGLQGLGGPKGILKSPWPLGTVGGDIFDVQKRLLELFKVAPPVTDTTTDARDDERVGLLEQLLREANLRTAVSERQFDVLRNFPPFGGQFATGGVVPGPAGAPRTVIAHGGETITPAGAAAPDTHVSVVIDGKVAWLRDFIDTRVEQHTRRATNHSRVLPGRKGG